MTTGEKIRFLREYNNLSRSQLEKSTGISEHTIKGYETRNFIPRLGVAQRLAEALGVTAGYILGSEDEPAPEVKPNLLVHGVTIGTDYMLKRCCKILDKLNTEGLYKADEFLTELSEQDEFLKAKE